MRLARLFSDHAVLQRDMSLPVWGWATPRRVVVVTLGTARAATVVDDGGRFLCRLPSQPAGGPHTLTATLYAEDGTTEATVRAHDIHLGEVWLASGQSNMAMTIEATGNDPTCFPAIRMFTVPRRAEAGPAEDVESSWIVATPAAVPSFSAVAYHFAAKLHQELGVVVGILHASWGGTVIEAWSSRAALACNPEMRTMLQRYDESQYAVERWSIEPGQALNAGLSRYRPADPGNAGVDRGWADADFDDAAWPSMTLPGAWTQRGHPISGVFWFRRTVSLDSAWAGKDLDLLLGGADKHDVTYWNGEEIGRSGEGFDNTLWNHPRHYRVPGRLARPGENVLAVRVYSFAFDGGLIGPRIHLTLAGEALADGIDLAGPWRYAIERDFGPTVRPPDTPLSLGPGQPNSPYILFDQMIRPLISYALRGVIWYQGEANVEAAALYRRQVVALAEDWRRRWKQGVFPFIQVQLASYLPATVYSDMSRRPYLREAQLQATAFRDLGMVSALDLGEADDIHPKNKRAVGERLAGWALARTYAHPGHVAHGPHYAGYEIEGDGIRVRFTGTEGGLTTRDGNPLGGFVITDARRCFRPAAARIDGDTVFIESPEIKQPVAARYAWADNPEGANLVNRAGLPASSFRTDRWRL